MEARREVVTLFERNSGSGEISRAAAHLAELTALSDRVGEAVFLSDAASGQLLDVNETACRWLGLSRSELLARSVRDLRGEPPLQVAPEADHPLTETREWLRPLVVEGICRRRNGSTFAVESSIAPVTVGGRECILAIVRDAKRRAHAVQQLRDYQDRYRRLFEEVRDAVIVTTRVGAIVEANGAALALFQCDRDEIVGVDLRRRLVFRPEGIRRFQEDTKRSGRVADLPVQLRRDDGDSVTAYLTAAPLFTVDGEVRGYQWIVRVSPPASDELGAESGRGAALGAATGSGVLLVVENQDARGEIEQALQQAGLLAIAVGEAGAAREIHRRRAEIGVVVVDILGSRRPAHDLLRALLAMSSVPIVAIGEESALSTTQRLTLSRRVEFLPGPAHPLALVQRVQAVLGREQGHVISS